MSKIDKILNDTSEVTMPIILYNQKRPFLDNTISNNIEAIKVAPTYLVMKLFMSYAFNPLKPALSGLENQISFINVDHESLKMSCDWCSICNGVIETAKINIIKNPALIDAIDFDGLSVINKYLSFALSGRKKTIKRRHAKQWCAAVFPQATFRYIIDHRLNNLIMFGLVYLKLESLELRWCPFKRAKEFYYRNHDPRYMPLNHQTIYLMGKILAHHETITCNNCPQLINQHTNFKPTRSIFEPLLNYMLDEICE